MSLTDIQNLYLQFLNNFPPSLQPIISIRFTMVLIIYSLFKVVKKDWIFIIALIILLPGSKPIYREASGRGLWCLLSFC